MTTQISLDNIQQATLNTIGSGPRITSVVVTDSSYNNLDDTAVDTAGGFIKILGAGFKTGCTVTVNRQQATSVTFISATEIRAQIPGETAGTYVVYVVNTDGSVALRVNGVTFSALPAWTTGSTLPNGDSGSAVSIQLAAAQATLYALAQGSTLPPGLTLSSSGLLSGTVTVASDTLYNFQVVATDAQLQDSPRTFSITISVGDPLFAQTTLLLPGSANTYVRDASTNNLAITPAGDARPNNFNPYLTGWSNSFTGSGDFLTLSSSSSAYNFGSGVDFTVEAWVYPTLLAGASWGIIDARVSAATSAAWIVHLVPSSGTYRLEFFNAGTNTGTAVIPLNTWTHVAVVRNGTALRTYVNGVLDLNLPSYGNGSISPGTTSPRVGPTKDASGTTYTNVGNISNLRIVNGTALYTSNFTPSTQPLTAVSGTSLLTCQSNRFRDTSTNNFAITTTGSVAVDSFNPFQEPATTNGSGFFDGTGDFLTVPTSSFFPAVNTYTIEMWAYPTSWPGSNSIALYHVTNSLIDFFGALVLVLTGSGTIRFDVRPSNGGTNVSITATSTIALNSWNHIAVSVNSGSVTLYINGVASGTGTVQVLNGTQAHCAIGYMTNGFTSGQSSFAGYISNVRVIRNTALYTANFTPPTSPLTAVANTSLLTLQTNQPHNNSQFLDSSSENHLITRNGNTTQGTFSPYSPSGWSNFFDGSGDSLSYTGTTFGTSAYTIECWFNISNFSTAYALLSTNNANALNIRINNATTIAIDQQNVAQVTFTVPAMGTNTWHHIAVVRNSSNICTVFVNGVRSSTGQTTISTNYNAASNLIGLIGSNAFPGYISNLRAVVGTALYDPTLSTLTVPTQPLTAVPGTSLLTCCDNRLIDDSVNNFAITRVGDVRVTNFSPFRAQTQVPNTYSAFFDGTGDFLSLPNAAFNNITTGTIECWVYLTSITEACITAKQQDGTTTQGVFSIGRYPSTLGVLTTGTPGVLYWHATNSSSPAASSTSAISANTWTHVAVVFSSTSATFYINGVASGTTSGNYSLPNNGTPALTVGQWTSDGTQRIGTTGYISNLRIVNGTALYTANFTLPTSPLTAVANTSLLTCQSPTFTDNSTNRFAITASGNSQPSMVNPFGSTFTPSTGYSAVDHGGSMYFDGTGDNLVLPLNPIFAIGTVDVTVEAWVYPTAANQPWSVIFAGAAFGSSSDWGLYLGTGTTALFPKFQFTNTVGQEVVSSVAVRQGEWSHIAVTRTAGTARIFINGVQTGTANASSWSLTNVHQKALGATAAVNGSTTLTGYISNLRVIAGRSLYSSNFAPPVAPVQPVQGTVLLLNGTSAGIADATTKNVLETVGDARVTTLVSRTGGSSMFFDGTGDRLIVPSSPNFDFPGDFTIEMWINLANVTSTWQSIISRAYGIAGGWRLYKNDGNNQLRWYSALTSVVLTTGSTLANNTWSHIAVVRNAGTVTIYIDGINRGSASNSTSYTPGNYALEIGEGVVTSAFPITGYIQDLRITQGTARYTANFTPPAGTFQTR